MPVSQMKNLHRGPASRGTASGHRLARATPGEFVVGRRTESDGTESNALDVVFYKEILDHCGFPHQCELMRVYRLRLFGHALAAQAANFISLS